MLEVKQNIGRLDRRITIQERILGENESNEDEEVGWTDIETKPIVWASIEDRSGNETYQGDGLTAYENSTITIRYRSDIKPTYRIVCDDRIYDILAIHEVSRKRFLSLTCVTGTTYQETTT